MLKQFRHLRASGETMGTDEEIAWRLLLALGAAPAGADGSRTARSHEALLSVAADGQWRCAPEADAAAMACQPSSDAASATSR